MQTARPELLDENEGVALGLVGQHAHRIAALEHLAGDGIAPAPGKAPVLHRDPIHGEVPIENAFLRKHAHIPRGETQAEAHGVRPAVYQDTSRLWTST